MTEPGATQHRTLIVSADAAGMRVDVYLALRFASWSRSAVAKAIREGQVRSTSRDLKPSSILGAGETLSLLLPSLAPESPKPACPPLLYEDRRVLAFDKSAGLLAHPTGERFTWGLINLARERFPNENLHLLHRLDRETSGVCLLARDPEANRFLKLAFKEHQARKTYLALVHGAPEWDETRLEGPIGDDEASPIRIKQAVRPDGQPAATHFLVRERFARLSLVECRPQTGRTHQLRVHLEALGFPILGDKIYGQDPAVFLSIFEGKPLEDLDERLGHPRHCLHAARLQVPHPDGGELDIEAPLPADMAALIDAARAGA